MVYAVRCTVLCTVPSTVQYSTQHTSLPRLAPWPSFFLVLPRSQAHSFIHSSDILFRCPSLYLLRWFFLAPSAVGRRWSAGRGQAQDVLGGSPPRSLILMIVDERHVAATPLPYTHTHTQN